MTDEVSSDLLAERVKKIEMSAILLSWSFLSMKLSTLTRDRNSPLLYFSVEGAALLILSDFGEFVATSGVCSSVLGALLKDVALLNKGLNFVTTEGAQAFPLVTLGRKIDDGTYFHMMTPPNRNDSIEIA